MQRRTVCRQPLNDLRLQEPKFLPSANGTPGNDGAGRLARCAGLARCASLARLVGRPAQVVDHQMGWSDSPRSNRRDPLGAGGRTGPRNADVPGPADLAHGPTATSAAHRTQSGETALVADEGHRRTVRGPAP